MNRAIKPNDRKWNLNITGKISLMAEALNNEETIGNYAKSRTIVGLDGELRNVISGASLRHNFQLHLKSQFTPDELCGTCRLFDPMKNGELSGERKDLSASGNRTHHCPVCDIMGFLNPDKTNSQKRSSPLLMADAISDADGTRSAFTRNRVDIHPEKADSTMMIWQEEVRTSTYNFAAQLDLSRIFFDDEYLKYTTNDVDKIAERAGKAIRAYIQAFLDITGAKMASHMPHLVGIEGVVTEITDGSQLATKYSALNEDYIAVHQAVENYARDFHSAGEFQEIMAEFLDEAYLKGMAARNLRYLKQL